MDVDHDSRLGLYDLHGNQFDRPDPSPFSADNRNDGDSDDHADYPQHRHDDCQHYDGGLTRAVDTCTSGNGRAEH